MHTHNQDQNGFTKVINYCMNTDAEINFNFYFSAGIHPWYLEDLEIQKDKLTTVSKEKNCLAIGECGLDKVCNTNLRAQRQVFIDQCMLALELKKPMIIHCVKAHFETIEILKEHKIPKAIFHGFNNRYTILEKILQEGYCVSFGEALLNERSQANALMKMVPKEKFLLETDDSNHSIDEIYKNASILLGTDTETLIQQQELNFHNFINA